MDRKIKIVATISTLIALLVLHFVPIKQDIGFIPKEVTNLTSTTCDFRTGTKRYLLITGGNSKYNEFKNKTSSTPSAGSNLNSVCAVGTEYTIKLYIL